MGRLNKAFLGIDPGLNGAIAVITEDNDLFCEITPTMKAKGAKTQYLVTEMVKIIDYYRRKYELSACIEKSQAMPLQGLSSTFKTGYGGGLWEGIIATFMIQYVIVAPRRWQKAVFTDVNTKDTKQASAIMAQRNFPNYDFKRTERCKKIHDGMTDATNIAFYRKNLYGETK